MKLPTIKMPAWGKRWYWLQLWMGMALAVNLWNGVFYIVMEGNNIAIAVSWFCVGLCFTTIFANIRVQRSLELMDKMNDAMHGLMELKTHEIGQAVAEHIQSIAGNDEMPTITRY